MNHRSVEHATIVVARVYGASPDRMFAAWSDAQAKAHWFNGSEGELDLDFRVGGWERGRGLLPDGREYAFEALYRDIVPDRRIVYTYDMFVDGIRISISLATAEFEPEGDGTRLVFSSPSRGRSSTATSYRSGASGVGAGCSTRSGNGSRATDPTAAERPTGDTCASQSENNIPSCAGALQSPLTELRA